MNQVPFQNHFILAFKRREVKGQTSTISGISDIEDFLVYPFHTYM